MNSLLLLLLLLHQILNFWLDRVVPGSAGTALGTRWGAKINEGPSAKHDAASTMLRDHDDSGRGRHVDPFFMFDGNIPFSTSGLYSLVCTIRALVAIFTYNFTWCSLSHYPVPFDKIKRYLPPAPKLRAPPDDDGQKRSTK